MGWMRSEAGVFADLGTAALEQLRGGDGSRRRAGRQP